MVYSFLHLAAENASLYVEIPHSFSNDFFLSALASW